jgi:hypothetical protein
MNEAIKAGDITQVAIIERWQWYFGALANPSAVGSASLPVHPGEYQLGYYRVRRKGGAWEPVGIYPDAEGRTVAYRDNRPVDDIPELFTWACRQPVTHKAYVDALEGKGWPDDDAVVAAQIAPPAPTIGDNSGEVDESEKLKDQIDAAIKGVDAYAQITDDETAAKAQSLRNRLNELSGEADKKRDALKRPYLDAGTKIDKTWMPLVKNAKAGADKVKAAMEAWETEKLRQRREEERRQQEDLRKQQEAALAAAPVSGDPEPIAAPVPEPLTVAAPTSIRASYGKAASVKATVVVDQVTDWPALAVYMSSHEECRTLLRQLAQRALDAGRTNIPGITVTEIAKVR